MVLRHIHGYLPLSKLTAPPAKAELRKAEAALGFSFPESYRQALEDFGCGSFGGERSLSRPSQTQTYGSRFDAGEIASPSPADTIVFAASDTGDSWGWSPTLTRGRAEPPIHLIPRGCFNLEDEWARPRVVAKNVRGLLALWRKDLLKKGTEEPYFVPAGPMMLVGDMAALSPGASIKKAHDALAKSLEGALRLFRADHPTGSLSRFYLRDASAVFSVQTGNPGVSRAGTNTTLRLQWLRAGGIDRARSALDTLTELGWIIERRKPGTIVWRDGTTTPPGFDSLRALLATSLGIKLASLRA